MAIVSRTSTNGKSTATTISTALIYTRVSKEEMAREGLSLDAQLAECRKYAAGQGWALGQEYQDVMSGKRDDRPSYQAMLADARQFRAEGKPVVIVVKWLHRLGRRVLERVRSREEMKSIGVTLHSIAEGGEVSDLIANILASVAEEEVRQLGERVRAVNQHLMQTGWARPGRTPWGYRFRPATPDERANGSAKAVLDVNPAAAPFVQEAFNRVARGDGLRAVMRWVELLPSTAREGKVLNRVTMRLIFKYPIYIAHQGVDGELSPGRWPALIDRATWERVQERLANHDHMPLQASGTYLLTGLLRCPRCAARMSGARIQATARKRSWRTYRCSDIGPRHVRSSDRKICSFTTSQPILDRTVVDEVARLVDAFVHQDDDVAALRRTWRELQAGGSTPDHAPRITQLEQARTLAQNRLKNAALKLVDGILDRAGYEQVRDQAQSDLAAAQGELDRLSTVTPSRVFVPALDVVLRDLGGWDTVLREGDTAAKRDILSLLIESVTPTRVGYGKYAVEITWTPYGAMLLAMAGAEAA